jgi:hypothetical protein
LDQRRLEYWRISANVLDSFTGMFAGLKDDGLGKKSSLLKLYFAISHVFRKAHNDSRLK